MSQNTGGPAFPAPEAAKTLFGEGQADRFMGMELRDYFAAKALQGLLAWPGDEASGSYHSNSDPAHTASMAYEYADAMLAARVKP
ncbi:hypothetical protein ACQKF2_16640 [Pseudomonas hunanensis]|uniref:hypothetical protein n=1 Tax=Pseudomonas hunanensis TaxID=1247546 RepID=UPI003CFF2AD0